MESSENSVADSGNKRICYQAGYLPVPLVHVPPEGLARLEIYLFNPQNKSYSLYRHRDLPFGKKDYKRLMESKVDFVYVSVRDHQIYYRTMENVLSQIVADNKIQEEKKAEILYSTSMELANQLLAAPPGKEEIERTANLARSTVQLIMNDKGAFGQLFEIFDHDFYTATHMVNVCSVSISLALKMGLIQKHELQNLGTGALLHDIGKIFIPSEVLNSTDKITPEQYDLLKTHVQQGYDHLTNILDDLPDETAAIIAEHHERMDGSGYPKGLKNDQISPLGRLAGITDTFEAMTSVRPYRAHTFSVEEALQQLEDEAPAKYDLEIVHAFAALIETTIKTEPDNNDQQQQGTSPTTAASRIASVDLGGPKHTQYYFRIPIIVRNIERVGGKLALGPNEKMIAHKISPISIGLLSPRSIPLDANIYIWSEKFTQINLSNLIAVVTNCRSHGDGWFTVEARFHNSQTAETIEQIRTITTVREISPLLKQ